MSGDGTMLLTWRNPRAWFFQCLSRDCLMRPHAHDNEPQIAAVPPVGVVLGTEEKDGNT